MTVLRIAGKVLLVPVVIVLTVIEWSGTFLLGIGKVLLYCIASLLLIVVAASGMLGIMPPGQCLRNAGIILGAVLASNLLDVLLGVIGALNDVIREEVFS